MQRLIQNILVMALMTGSLAPLRALAQDSGTGKDVTDDLNVIEMELDKGAPKQPPANSNTAPGAAANLKSPDLSDEKVESQNNKLSDFSGLGKLAPFSEISVLQKRYLPKTNRFQFTAAFTYITNNPWFLTAGVTLKGAYYFSEAWGVEGTFSSMSSSQRKAAEELYSNNSVAADAFGFPKSYIGADAKYTPFYGKMTWLNQHIIPFEHYVTAGLGETSISTGTTAPTLHVGTGQNFAMSKRFSVNWDLSAMYYSGKGSDGSTQSYNDILLTVGMSFFYPEASYR